MSNYSGLKEKTQKYRSLFSEIIQNFIKIVMIYLIIIKNNAYITKCTSEIKLVIQGSGIQDLLNQSFDIQPSEVLVNGILNNSCGKTCNLNGDKNNITLKFGSEITSCKDMFRGLTNIIEVDLSKFNASKVKSMQNMFYQCSNLEKYILEIWILLLLKIWLISFLIAPN